MKALVSAIGMCTALILTQGASAKGLQKWEVEEVNDKAAIAKFVKEARKVDPSLKRLKPEYVKKIFTTSARCQGKEIVTLSDNHIEVPIALLDDDTLGFPTIGSAGAVVRIFLKNKNGKLESLVFEDNLINLQAFLEHGDCPEIIVEVHGSKFDRVGSKSGKTLLKWEDGKFKYQRRDEKLIEYFDGSLLEPR